MAKKASRLPQFLALGGLGFFILAMILLKHQPVDDARNEPVDVLPQEQLQQALQAGTPVLAFFHSNTCQQCIEMISIVGEVYPRYADTVELVDVNVYDERNAALLQQVRLQFIPTLIFYDQSGEANVVVGVMQDEELNQALADLAGGN